MMFAVLSASALIWLAAHEGFFFAYHRALELPFTATSAVFSALFAAWTFALVATLRNRWARAAALTVYAVTLALLLVDYAYFQVFSRFLPLSFSRAGSLNLPTLRLLKDYLFLIPIHLVAGAAGLFTLGVCCAVFVPRHLTRRALRVPLAGGDATFARGGRGWLATAGVTAQILILSLASVASDAYRTSVSTGTKEPFAVLSDLGAFGYAIAAERGAAEARLKPRAVAGLENARTDVQVTRDALSALAALSPAGQGTHVSLPKFSKPPNVIIYQMESVDAWPLEQEPSPMPFLESMMEKYGSVGDYVANGCTTIDAEFAVSCGFLPETNGPVSDLYAKNDYRCLPGILKDRGYSTSIYHANDPEFWMRKTLAPAWGYGQLHFSPEIPFRDTDTAVLDRVVDSLKTADKPTFSYVIGFTSHSPHGSELAGYYEKVKHLAVPPYAAPLGETAASTDADEATVRQYLGFMTSVDDSLRHLFDRLEKEGLAENTIVVAFGDHRYYDSKAADPLARFRRYNRIPLLFYVPGLKNARLAPVASHADIAPTLFHLITGGESGLPESFVGTSLFSQRHPPGAVTKCLGQAIYYDGSTVVSGDVALGAMSVLPPDSADQKAEPLKKALLDVVAASDLALKRNELGSALVPSQVEAMKKVDGSNLADTDGDGLSDLRESAIGTDRNKADTDGDGYDDGVEAANGFDPRGSGRWVSGTVR